MPIAPVEMFADETASKAAWLAKQQLPSWGPRAAAAVSEAAAKAAWLAKQV